MRRIPRAVLVAVAVGGAGGVLARGLLVDLAFALGGPPKLEGGCGMEEVLECTVAAMPAAVATLVEVGLVLLGLMALTAGAGLTLLVIGLLRARGHVHADRLGLASAFTGAVLAAAPASLLASLL